MLPAQRLSLRLVLAAIVAAVLSTLVLAPAHAAAYRFWGFYQLTGSTWAFAQKGPDQIIPKDGTVEGWRFAVADEQSTRFPRAVLTFDQICGGKPPAQPGTKRVGLVVDFGRAADAPDAAATPPEPKALCAEVTADATSTQVLKAAGDLRVEGGLVCAVDGYPATDCGGAVKEVSPEAAAADAPVTIAAPASTPSSATTATDAATANAASPSAPAEDGGSGTSTAAYVIAGLVLLAILAFVIMRSRASARRDS